MTAALLVVLPLAAICGVSAAGLYLTWPRRLTAEEYMARRRAMSTPPVTRAPSPKVSLLGTLAGRLDNVDGLASLVHADLALLRLAGHGGPATAREMLARLVLRAAIGGLAGLLLSALLLLAGGTVSPFVAMLPLTGALFLPAWTWLSLRRSAAQQRAGIERRLPRLLVSSRVLLESGAATPEGAVTDAVTIYEDAAADVVREALLARGVRRVPLESALDEVAEQYGITTLARLADSFRVGVRYGTRMADLLAEQSAQVRKAGYAAYRERITRAPVLMTIPALLFFVTPLLVLVMFLVFVPLERALGQL